LVNAGKLTGSNGVPLVQYGKGFFALSMSSLKIEKEIIVADVKDEGLLGIDILQDENNGSADILLSQGIIRLMGVEIPCLQVGLSEKVRDEIDDYVSQLEFLIEPNQNFNKEYYLLLAPAVVNIKNNTSVKVGVMNPFSTDVSINQDVVLGYAQHFDQILGKISETENVEENAN